MFSVVEFSCQHEFPGLVHFVFLDRSRGHICAPALSTDFNQQFSTEINKTDGMQNSLEKKVRHFFYRKSLFIKKNLRF